MYSWISEKQPELVLDIGCGTGDFFDQRYPKYIGIDINEKFISFAKRKYKKFKNAKFVVEDALSYNYKEESRKRVGIILVSMMHHLSDEQLFSLFNKIQNLRLSSLVVCDIIPNPKGYLEKLMVVLDQGSYIRNKKRKIEILSRYFDIIDTKMIKAGLAAQCGIVCKLKK